MYKYIYIYIYICMNIHIYIYIYIYIYISAPSPPLFLAFLCNNLFVCNHFGELQTMLIEVKLIVNNTPVTCVFPNTIKACLTLNHLFGRQLLYYFNTTSTVVSNLTVPSNTTDKINCISNHF